jgi:PPOX class probable F420-dependent enzyme
MPFDPAVRALLEGKNYCHVATHRRDGTIQLVPVWVDTDGEHVLLNSAEGRGWVRNLDAEPRLTCTVMNMENPYEFVQIRGHVADRTNEGARDHINKMAKKYFGADEYPGPADEQRVIFRIAPDHVQHWGAA